MSGGEGGAAPISAGPLPSSRSGGSSLGPVVSVRGVLLVAIVLHAVVGGVVWLYPAAVVTAYTGIAVDTHAGTATNQLLVTVAELLGAVCVALGAALVPLWHWSARSNTALWLAYRCVGYGLIPACVLLALAQVHAWQALSTVRPGLDASGFKFAIGLHVIVLALSATAVASPPPPLLSAATVAAYARRSGHHSRRHRRDHHHRANSAPAPHQHDDAPSAVAAAAAAPDPDEQPVSPDGGAASLIQMVMDAQREQQRLQQHIAGLVAAITAVRAAGASAGAGVAAADADAKGDDSGVAPVADDPDADAAVDTGSDVLDDADGDDGDAGDAGYAAAAAAGDD